MGLAGPKNRSKISHDPQNTTWANNTTRFGHRMLTSQGWTPGATLGAKDASHSAHYTAASNSHIRVLLKEDTLGLGAKRGSERAENFGLAALESVLGRLNGKEEEVKKEEERRDEIERRGLVYRKYGFMNFVSGGFLVGDKIEKGFKLEGKDEAKDVKIKVEPTEDGLAVEVTEKKAKKRKRSKDEAEAEAEEKVEDEEPKLKRKKKSMNLREVADAEARTDNAEKKDKSDKKHKDKKEKKEKKAEKRASKKGTDSEDSVSAGGLGALKDRAKRKADKAAHKEEKKLQKALKKAARKAAKEAKEARSKDSADASSSSEDSDVETPASTSAPSTGTSTPAGLVFGAGGRHAVRQRYIRQKKMASMDPQALKEIFMIKTPS